MGEARAETEQCSAAQQRVTPPPSTHTSLHLSQNVVVARLEWDVEKLAELVQLGAGPAFRQGW